MDTCLANWSRDHLADYMSILGYTASAQLVSGKEDIREASHVYRNLPEAVYSEARRRIAYCITILSSIMYSVLDGTDLR